MKSILRYCLLLSSFFYLQYCIATELIIPAGTKKIATNATKDYFYRNDITSVVIPDSVTEIDAEAFEYCHNLASVTLPDSVTKIGPHAFHECESLTSIVIPDGVTEIDEGVFSQCKNLASVTLSDSVTKIGPNAFHGCRSLASVTLPDSITEIHAYTFDGCESLTSIVIPGSVTKIGFSAFANCHNLTSIVIPDSVIEIERNAFDGCGSLDREVFLRWEEARIAAEKKVKEERIAAEKKAEEERISQLKEKLNTPIFNYPYDSLCDSHIAIFRDFSSGMSEESIQAKLSLAKIKFESISGNTISAQDLNRTISALEDKKIVYLSAIKFEYKSGQSCLLLFGHQAPDSLNGALIGAIWNVSQQIEEEMLIEKFKNEFSGGTLSKKFNPQKNLASNQLKEGLAEIGYVSGLHINPDDVKIGSTSYTFKLGNRVLTMTTPTVLNLDAIEDDKIKQTVSAYFNTIMSLNSSNAYSICCFDAKWVEIYSKLCAENEKILKEKRMNEDMQNLGF